MNIRSTIPVALSRNATPLLTTALLLVFLPVIQAQTYNAVGDFSVASDPNGPWAYGSGATGRSFVLLPNSSTTNCGGGGLPDVECWQTLSDPPFYIPIVSQNISGETIDTGSVVLPPDVLSMHPSSSSDAIVQWTAPKGGKYRVTLLFEILDISPTGVIVTAYLNSTLKFYKVLTGPGANQQTSTPGQKVSFSFTEFVSRGSTISFGVNNDGNVNDDSTGFQAVITKE